MRWKLEAIDDIHNFWRFRSVQFGSMAGGFSAALVAYGAAYTISPTLVSGIPHWFLTVCTIGSMVCAWLSVVSRGVKQNLPEKPDV